MVEYAGLAAALTVLVASLNGVFGSALPSNSTKAATLIAAVARSHGVSTSRARTAYAHAPYRRTALRYLYTVGWVGSASNLGACKLQQALGQDPTAAATQALQSSPKALVLLRGSHLTVSQAATAVARGTTDGCA